MGYTTDDSMIRVDFFKESGKWYTTEAVKIEYPKRLGLTEVFAKSLKNHFIKEGNPERLSEMTAVCLYPYYDDSFPVMIKNGDWLNYG